MKDKIINAIQFNKVENILLSEKSLEIVFSEIQDYVPILEFKFIGPYLSIMCVLEKKENYLSRYKLKSDLIKNDFIYRNKTSEYSVKVIKEPFEFSIIDNKDDILFGSNSALGECFSINFNSVDKIKSLKLNLKTNSTCFYGFGERFDKIDQSGKTPDMNVVEQYGNQNEKTYMPVPFFITEKNYGIYFNSARYTRFELPAKGQDSLVIETDVDAERPLLEMFMLFGAPKKLIKDYLEITGYPKLPPKWSFGPWMSSNGWNTQKEVLEQVDMMKKLEIPATVIVIEAWSDEATFYIFNDAKYNLKKEEEYFKYQDFEFDSDGKWPNPKKMIENIHENNLKLVLWQIPVLKYCNEIEQHFIDERYAIDKGFCVLNPDGTPYRIPKNWFCNSLVFDFTNPKARKWWFEKRKYLIEDLGVDGFKTDGGEFIHNYDVHFYDGRKGYEMRNLYPIDYIAAYNEFISESRITFSRAGYTGSQRFPLYWAGDQLSTFTEFKSQLIAGLSASISGNPFWGFDIGGFAGEMPSAELYIRSAQMATFCPVMQFHSTNRDGYNNDRSPWNVSKFTGDERVIEIYRKFANIRMNLLPYIYNEAKYSAVSGEPLMKHLILDYPEDELVYDIEDEYLFGRSLLITPIIQEDALQRDIYLPKGGWVDFWDGASYEGGRNIVYSCELDRIPVFIKNDSILPLNLNEEFEIGGRIGNRIDQHGKLCFIVTGQIKVESEFSDELVNRILFYPASEGIDVKFEGNINEIHIMTQDAAWLGYNNFSVKFNSANFYIHVIKKTEFPKHSV